MYFNVKSYYTFEGKKRICKFWLTKIEAKNIGNKTDATIDRIHSFDSYN